MNQPGFELDVLAEPETLAAMLDAYAAADSPARGVALSEAPRVVMIGMGSSCFAAQTAATLMRSRCIDAYVELASVATPTPPSPETLAIGISASGTTVETVEALARHHGVSRTMAITNYPERVIADHAERTLPLLAGIERGGVSCKSFQTTLALLRVLAGDAIDHLRAAPEAAAALRDGRNGWLDGLLGHLAGAAPIYTIAPVERISSALESALMFREGPRIAADGTETGDWLHVDVYLSKHPGYRALLFAGSRYDPGVMRWATERASTIVAVGAPVTGAALSIDYPHSNDPAVASLVETMVAELAASELWKRQSV